LFPSFNNKYFVKIFDNKIFVIIFDNKNFVKMKNSLGNPARGEAFYDRSNEIKKIYRVLKTGASIYLAAPRRVGKTSILRHLEESAEPGYYFVYVITESIDDENEFFKEIFEQLIKSDAIKTISKASAAVKQTLAILINKVSSFQGVELREGTDPDYYELLIELFRDISSEHGRLVIMIDEFPQTIQNILDKSGKDIAQKFIQKNRELRHHKNVLEKTSFIYTGSVSLFPMIQKVTSLTSINDLRTVEVSPLEPKDAKVFIALLLRNDKIILSEQLLEYIILKIKWLIPFHLQLIQQEIIDVHESSEEPIDEDSINKAFEQVVHSRNKPQFEPYFSRLEKLFKLNEFDFVMDILKNVAVNDKIGNDILNDRSVKFKISEPKLIMEILESDGYLFFTDGAYQYTSPILQLWCKKHICK
jgi:hypothetical protein